MEWQFVLALVIAVPIILVPVALVWYLCIGGVYRAVKQSRQRRALHEAPPAIAEETALEELAERELAGTRR